MNQLESMNFISKSRKYESVRKYEFVTRRPFLFGFPTNSEICIRLSKPGILFKDFTEEPFSIFDHGVACG